MSRSHRHYGVSRNTRRSRYFKRVASSAVRNHKDPLPNGNFYRRLYDRWNIYDCYWCQTLEECVKDSIERGDPIEKGYAYWAAQYHSK